MPVYTHKVTKRLIDIDDELLAEARAILETNTMKDTVNAALERISDMEVWRRHAIRLSTEGLDLQNPDIMRDAWR
jgi:Arc/MetJ family transcription regulator